MFPFFLNSLWHPYKKIRENSRCLRCKSFYDKIAVSMLKTKIYLLTLHENNTNVMIMMTGIVIKNSSVFYYAVIVRIDILS